MNESIEQDAKPESGVNHENLKPNAGRVEHAVNVLLLSRETKMVCELQTSMQIVSRSFVSLTIAGIDTLAPFRPNARIVAYFHAVRAFFRGVTQ
jgi:hypothetical protein